jgi:hypothetical protein
MRPSIPQASQKRINLKISDDLHTRLKIQAAKGRATLQDLVTRWLEEKLQESEAREMARPVDPALRQRIEQLVGEFRAGVPTDASPEEIEAEITAARAEVREAHRAGRR